MPKSVKQSITTMQIMQFIIGVNAAAIHSFLSYDVPRPADAATSEPAEPVASAASAASATFKRIIYRGNVSAVANASAAAYEYPAYETAYDTVPCIDTSGETLAIWLNVFYLGPLMYLFMRFFYRSYLRRIAAPAKPANGSAPNGRAYAAEAAIVDAAKGVERGMKDGNVGRM